MASEDLDVITRELEQLLDREDIDISKNRHLIAQRIERLIKLLGTTRDGLAKRLGVNPYTVYRWLKGKATPHRSVIRKLRETAGSKDVNSEPGLAITVTITVIISQGG